MHCLSWFVSTYIMNISFCVCREWMSELMHVLTHYCIYGRLRNTFYISSVCLSLMGSLGVHLANLAI